MHPASLLLKVLPHDSKARRLFVTSGGLKKVQEIKAEPGSPLQEHINAINSCFPEEIVRYTQTRLHTQTLLTCKPSVVRHRSKASACYQTLTDRQTVDLSFRSRVLTQLEFDLSLHCQFEPVLQPANQDLQQRGNDSNTNCIDSDKSKELTRMGEIRKVNSKS